MKRPMPGPPDKSMHDPHKRRGIIHRSCPWCKPFCAPSKHLTDAECAAEYWRTKADLATIEAVLVSPAAMNARGRVWHRFATHPHALEGDHA